jgi:hypothetical protein
MGFCTNIQTGRLSALSLDALKRVDGLHQNHVQQLDRL